MIRAVPLGDCDAGGSAELLEQRLALLGAEALDPAGLADADLLHRAAGLDLADAGQGLEHGDDLQLADDVVACRPGRGPRSG